MSDTNTEQAISIKEPAIKPQTHRESLPTPPRTSAIIDHDDQTQNLEEVRDKIKKVKTGVYKGLTGSYLRRGIEGYENAWNREGYEDVTYDQLVTSAIEQALADGRQEVVVFDFGCGEGNAMTTFLQDDQSEAMKKIKENPDLQLKLIGLTDTPGIEASDEVLASGKQLKSPNDEPINVSAQIDYYAVTAARTLENYFVEHDITSIDVAMAVQSLAYLPAKNFEATVASIASRLKSPNSTFIASAYTNQVPGFDTYAYPSIDIQNFSREPGVRTTLQDGWTRFSDPNIDIEEEGTNLKSVIGRYVSMGVLSQAEVDKRIEQELKLSRTAKIKNALLRHKPQFEELYKADDPRNALGKVADLLSSGQENLYIIRGSKLVEQKEAALNKLKSQYADSLDISFSENVIRMKHITGKKENEQGQE